MPKDPEAVPQLRAIARRPGVTVPWDRITVNRWWPSTCGCVLEQWFDDADPSVVLYARTVEACAAHPEPTEQRWRDVRGENDRLTAVLTIVEALGDADARERVTWRFLDERVPGSGERQLEVGVPPTLRTAVQSALTLQFGATAARIT